MMVIEERRVTDLVKERPEFFSADRRPALVHLSAAKYLTLTGGGEPTRVDGCETHFQASIARLYRAAYALKQRCKRDGRDFIVPALQALWLPYRTFGDQPRDVAKPDPTTWRWKLMIMVPDFVEPAMIEAGAEDTGCEAPIVLETVDEGLCVQALHAGPYKEEHHTIHAIRTFMARSGLRACSLHDEIYLSDPTRTAPARLRTILRQPVRSAEEESPCPDEW